MVAEHDSRTLVELGLDGQRVLRRGDVAPPNSGHNSCAEVSFSIRTVSERRALPHSNLITGSGRDSEQLDQNRLPCKARRTPAPPPSFHV